MWVFFSGIGQVARLSAIPYAKQGHDTFHEPYIWRTALRNWDGGMTHFLTVYYQILKIKNSISVIITTLLARNIINTCYILTSYYD